MTRPFIYNLLIIICLTAFNCKCGSFKQILKPKLFHYIIQVVSFSHIYCIKCIPAELSAAVSVYQHIISKRQSKLASEIRSLTSDLLWSMTRCSLYELQMRLTEGQRAQKQTAGMQRCSQIRVFTLQRLQGSQRSQGSGFQLFEMETCRWGASKTH